MMKLPCLAVLLAPLLLDRALAVPRDLISKTTSRHELQEMLMARSRDGRRTLNHRIKGSSAGTGSRHLQQPQPLKTNCGPEAVSDWVEHEMSRKQCEDLPLTPLGAPVCEQYENFNSVSQCEGLVPQTIGFSSTSSSQEECRFFVSELLPNPYFRDVDNLNQLFGTTGEFPVRSACRESKEMCVVEVEYNNPEEELESNATFAPTPAPYMTTVPCTKCDFYYQDDEVCFNADCGLFQCVWDVGLEEEGEGDDSGNNNSTSMMGNSIGDSSLSSSSQTSSQLPSQFTEQQDSSSCSSQILQNDNNTFFGCPALPGGEVNCCSCLEAGCGATEGQCLRTCDTAPADVLCWATQFFDGQSPTELCNIKAEFEADVEICGSPDLTDCQSCTGTLKSDGVNPCEWYNNPGDDGPSGFCGRGGCNIFGFCGKKTCETDPDDHPNEYCDRGECVAVCFKSYRSDLFSFREYRQGDLYGCSMQTEAKVWTTEFHLGATNVRTLQFKVGEWHSTDEEDEDDDKYLDYCEISVDGVACSKCAFCGVNDTAHLDIDCTNIVPEAITSCGSLQDLYYGIVHKLVVLEDGYTHPPTDAPTGAPSAAPSETTLTNDVETTEIGRGGNEDSNPDAFGNSRPSLSSGATGMAKLGMATMTVIGAVVAKLSY